MSLNLTKNETVNLVQKRILIGFGWELVGGSYIDIDASIFCINPRNLQVITVNSQSSETLSGAVKYYEPDENVFMFGCTNAKQMFTIDFNLLPKNIKTIKIVLKTHSQKDNLCNVENCAINIRDLDSDEEILRYDIEEDDNMGNNGIFVADIFCQKDECQFKAIGKSVKVRNLKKMIPWKYRIFGKCIFQKKQKESC